MVALAVVVFSISGPRFIFVIEDVFFCSWRQGRPDWRFWVPFVWAASFENLLTERVAFMWLASFKYLLTQRVALMRVTSLENLVPDQSAFIGLAAFIGYVTQGTARVRYWLGLERIRNAKVNLGITHWRLQSESRSPILGEARLTESRSSVELLLWWLANRTILLEKWCWALLINHLAALVGVIVPVHILKLLYDFIYRYSLLVYLMQRLILQLYWIEQNEQLAPDDWHRSIVLLSICLYLLLKRPALLSLFVSFLVW